MSGMERFGFFRRLRVAGALLTRGASALDDVPDGVRPPSRTPAGHDPLTVSTVFRGVQVLQTAITGIPIYETRNGLRLDTVSSLVARPDVNRSRRDFLSDVVASMVLDGNAFVRLVRFDGQIVTCEVLPPQYVTVTDTGGDPASPRLRYSYLGREYGPDDIVHCKFLNVPGRLRGLGPISAAREEVESAAMARDYKTRFYTDGSNLKGYVTTEANVGLGMLKELKKSWNEEGGAGQVRFVSNGLKYVPLDMKPADLQFLETQKFDTTQIARLLGIPASIMLAAVDGSNLTYSNIEQSWIEFADYTLSAYAGEIEELFARLLPRGREARFDWDSSRRTNMSERFAAWGDAIDHGWMTANEVRAERGMAPLPGGGELQHQSQGKEENDERP